MDNKTREITIQEDKILITEVEVKEIALSEKEDIQRLKQKLKAELASIVKSVKAHKERAEEIKTLLAEIEKTK